MSTAKSRRSRGVSADMLLRLPFTAREIYDKLEREHPERLESLAENGELLETLTVSGDALLDSFVRHLRGGKDVETALMYVRMEMDDLPVFRTSF